MTYIGIWAPDSQGNIPPFLQHAEKQGADVWTSSHVPTVAMAWMGERQPLQLGAQEDGLCAIDGRIQGTGKLRSEHGVAGVNKADVILRAWLRQGDSVLKDLGGTASMTLWDAASQRLVLVRAHNGIPPIFFAEAHGALLWSNSLRMLLTFGAKATLDYQALDAYFAMGYVPSPWTLIESIRKVPAGQFLEYGRSRQVFNTYWEPVQQSQRVRDIDARAATLKEKLCRSLENVVGQYDRVGVLLSSGVDSSLLVALLHRELGVPVEAFTFHYSDYEGKYNEYDRACLLTSRFGIPHHKIQYSAEWLKSNLSEAVKQYEEPFTYGQHTARLDEVAQKGIMLLLNGALSDNGFISRPANYALKIDGSVAKKLARRGHTLLGTWPFNKASRMRHIARVVASSPEEIFYGMRVNYILPDSVRQRLYRDSSRHETGREALMCLFKKTTQQSGLDRKAERLSHLKNSLFMPDHLMWWNYRWARAHQLEMGAPFLTSEMRTWMESLQHPIWPPYQESIRKVLIRRVAQTVMPDEIATYQKIAQSTPLWVWLQGPLRSMLYEYLQPSKLREDGLFDVEFVQQAIQEHTTGRVWRPYLLWTLLCFMVWKEEVLE